MIKTLYIKDDEMPKCCRECTFRSDEFVTCLNSGSDLRYCKIGSCTTPLKDVYKECPLRPLSDAEIVKDYLRIANEQSGKCVDLEKQLGVTQRALELACGLIERPMGDYSCTATAFLSLARKELA